MSVCGGALNKRAEKPVADILRRGYPNARVEIVWAEPQKMRQLNQSHRRKNEPTDVLSFPLYSYRELAAPKQKSGENVPTLLGTLVLCRSLIRARAREEGMSYDERLRWTIEHGLKHLLGYDHDATGQHWRPSTR